MDFEPKYQNLINNLVANFVLFQKNHDAVLFHDFVYESLQTSLDNQALIL